MKKPIMRGDETIRFIARKVIHGAGYFVCAALLLHLLILESPYAGGKAVQAYVYALKNEEHGTTITFVSDGMCYDLSTDDHAVVRAFEDKKGQYIPALLQRNGMTEYLMFEMAGYEVDAVWRFM